MVTIPDAWPFPAELPRVATPAEQRYRKAYCAGGHLVHALPDGCQTALCGHAPRNTGRMNRAKWRVYREDAQVSVTCKRCIEKLAKKEGTA